MVEAWPAHPRVEVDAGHRLGQREIEELRGLYRAIVSRLRPARVHQPADAVRSPVVHDAVRSPGRSRRWVLARSIGRHGSRKIESWWLLDSVGEGGWCRATRCRAGAWGFGAWAPCDRMGGRRKRRSPSWGVGGAAVLVRFVSPRKSLFHRWPDQLHKGRAACRGEVAGVHEVLARPGELVGEVAEGRFRVLLRQLTDRRILQR